MARSGKDSGVRGRNRTLLAAAVILALSLAVPAYFAVRGGGPDIPFADLPPETQRQITQNLTLGRQSADIEDWDGAARFFLAAYDLHPHNAEAEEGLDRVVANLLRAAARVESTRQREYLLQVIEGYSGNEYLATHRQLQALRARLEAP